jgi:predicted Fe-Mo cluster-binding NifX family protein
MRIAVTASQPSLDGQVDPRFGRCAYYVIADLDTLDFEALPNPYALAMGGAGIQSAQLIASRGVEIVVSGNYGPNAVQTLNAVGVRAIAGAMRGSVRQAIEQFKQGALQPVVHATVGPYSGIGVAPRPGRGMGGAGRRALRRRGGTGGSRAAGARGAQGTFPPQFYPPDPTAPLKQPPVTSRSGRSELEMLKRQAAIVTQQLKAITDRIAQIGRDGREQDAPGK